MYVNTVATGIIITILSQCRTTVDVRINKLGFTYTTYVICQGDEHLTNRKGPLVQRRALSSLRGNKFDCHREADCIQPF